MKEKERNKIERLSVYYWNNKVNGVIWTGKVTGRETMRNFIFRNKEWRKEKTCETQAWVTDNIRSGLIKVDQNAYRINLAQDTNRVNKIANFTFP